MKKTKASPKSKKSQKKRILLVEDHPMTRMGLKMMIASEPGLEICGEAGSAGEALDAAFFRLTLSDNGIGIDSDPAARAKLFESGYTTKPRGTGYGLHAAALFAREVGGSVSLDSPGRMRGATLTLVLPFMPASGIADAAAASLSGSMQ